jgi:hypothetical protein
MNLYGVEGSGNTSYSTQVEDVPPISVSMLVSHFTNDEKSKILNHIKDNIAVDGR